MEMKNDPGSPGFLWAPPSSPRALATKPPRFLGRCSAALGKPEQRQPEIGKKKKDKKKKKCSVMPGNHEVTRD